MVSLSSSLPGLVSIRRGWKVGAQLPGCPEGKCDQPRPVISQGISHADGHLRGDLSPLVKHTTLLEDLGPEEWHDCESEGWDTPFPEV